MQSVELACDTVRDAPGAFEVVEQSLDRGGEGQEQGLPFQGAARLSAACTELHDDTSVEVVHDAAPFAVWRSVVTTSSTLTAS